jgi:hypothetical protein
VLRQLPQWKLEFTQIRAPQFPHLVDQLEFLANGVEDAVEVARRTVAGRCEELDRALAAATTTPVAVLRLDGWDQGYTILTTQTAFAAQTGGGSC